MTFWPWNKATISEVFQVSRKNARADAHFGGLWGKLAPNRWWDIWWNYSSRYCVLSWRCNHDQTFTSGRQMDSSLSAVEAPPSIPSPPTFHSSSGVDAGQAQGPRPLQVCMWWGGCDSGFRGSRPGWLRLLMTTASVQHSPQQERYQLANAITSNWTTVLVPVFLPSVILLLLRVVRS